MKPISALILAVVAGVTTFAAEAYLYPPQLHAAAFVVPTSADWRQQMIDRDPGGAVVDRELAHLTDKLDLTDQQVVEARPILERQHERILALLVSGPPSLTRDEFVAERQVIRDQTRRQLDALLTPDQMVIARDLHRPGNG